MICTFYLYIKKKQVHESSKFSKVLSLIILYFHKVITFQNLNS